MNFSRLPSLCSAIAAVTLVATQVQAAEEIDLTSQENRIGYSIGVNIGQNLAGQGLMESINLDAFLAGVRDVVTAEPQLTQEEMMTALTDFQQQMMDDANAAAEQTRSESEAFLAENGQRSGVTTTASGLQYEVIESGAAGPSPTTADSVLAHYQGTFIDGAVFDSSIERGEPARFGVGQVIAGWTEALQMMKVGDKWRLFIPSDLAYGEMGSGPIGPHSALIFDVELLEINPQ